MDMSSPLRAQWLIPDVSDEAGAAPVALNNTQVIATITFDLTILAKPNSTSTSYAGSPGARGTENFSLSGIAFPTNQFAAP
jgi:hypothetical protein